MIIFYKSAVEKRRASGERARASSYYFIMLAVCSALLMGCGKKEPTGLNGKFFLATCFNSAYDVIEFFPDGKCVVGEGEHHGGTYHAYPDGRLMIEVSAFVNDARVYQHRLTDRTLILSESGKRDLIYVRPPRSPAPGWKELIGTRLSHTDFDKYSTDVVIEMGRDQKFTLLQRLSDHSDKTYTDYQITGTWYYGDGVTTCRVEDSKPRLPLIYFRSFVTKRDTKGVWFLEPLTGREICSADSPNLALPPPAEGYRPAAKR